MSENPHLRVHQDHPTIWRSWDNGPNGGKVPLVEIPRALFLDLVAIADPWCFGAVLTHEECEEGLHEQRAEEHRLRMDSICKTASWHLSDQDIAPSAEALGRVLCIVYECMELTKTA